MIGFIVKKFIGSKNDREVKRLRPLVARINELEAELQKEPDETLRQKTAAWKEELSKIGDREELLGVGWTKFYPKKRSRWLRTPADDCAAPMLSSASIR